MSFRTTLVVAAILAMSAAVSAAVFQTIQVDEFGNGTDQFGNPMQVQFAPDPTNGIAGNVLIYTLPFFPTTGDVIMKETSPDGQGAVVSDVIRFYTGTDNLGHLNFYSDNEPPPDNAFDSGLPAVNWTPNVTVVEQYIGNYEWSDYTPAAGAPGFDTSGVQQSYKFISDVPEPATLALFGAAAMLLAARRTRRD